jgi:hypothetical protein
MPPPWLLAVDPAVNDAGLALFRHGELVWAWVAQAEGAARADRWHWYARHVRHALEQRGVDERELTLVVERMQAYPRSPVDPNDLLDVQGTAGAVVGAVPQARRVVAVHPREWKGQRPKSAIVADVRRAGIRDALIVAPSAGVRHNAVEAVGIGLWYLRRNSDSA